MPQELVSRRTRSKFQEFLVSWKLREIREIFDNHAIESIPLSQNQLPSGERRSLVECYYASVDWSNPRDVRRILDVFEDILIEIPTTEEEEKQKLVRHLEKDGYVYDHEQIVSRKLDTVLVEAIAKASLDTKHLYIYVDRINASVETDPSLAIGSTKELIEATLKTILNGCSFEYNDKKDDIPKLLKKVQKVLQLIPDEVDGSKKGAEIIKRVLSNLGSIAISLTELRNLYGSGHGRDKIQGITARHAKLVVGSGTALCTFLLETYEHRDNVKLLHLNRPSSKS